MRAWFKRSHRTLIALLALAWLGACGQEQHPVGQAAAEPSEPSLAMSPLDEGAVPILTKLAADEIRMTWVGEVVGALVKSSRWQCRFGSEISRVTIGLDGTGDSGRISSSQDWFDGTHDGLTDTGPSKGGHRSFELVFDEVVVTGEQALAIVMKSEDSRVRDLEDALKIELDKAAMSLFSIRIDGDTLTGVIPGSVHLTDREPMYRSHLGSKVGDSNSFRAGEKISLSRRLWAPKGGARSLSVSSRDDTIRVNGEDVTFEDFEGAGWSLWIRLDT